MQPRRAQQPITIRSDRAAARLAVLTRDGRSQAQVIEEALDRLPVPLPPADDLDRRRAELEALLEDFDPKSIPSMAQFDAQEYDAQGNPR